LPFGFPVAANAAIEKGAYGTVPERISQVIGGETAVARDEVS